MSKLNIIAPKLTSYQKDILYNEFRFTITEASTKVGKTFSHLWWLFEKAHSEDVKPNNNYWWVAPIYAQAKIAFKRLRERIRGVKGYKVNESNLIVTTPLLTHIHFKSAEKPDNLFGEDVYAAVFDEAPRARKDAWTALRSTLTATNGKCKLIGNFGGSANWMHQLKKKASEKDTAYGYFRVTAWDAVREGILTEEEILQAQKDLSPKDFKQLYLAEEQESDDMLVEYANINDLWTNTFVQGGNKYISADIALHGSDKFVVKVWDGLRLIDNISIDKIDADAVVELIKNLAEKHNVPRSQIAYDADGLGSYLRGYLRGAVPFVNNSKPIPIKGTTVNYASLKDQCLYELAKVIRGNEMLIDCDVDIEVVKQELEFLRSYQIDNDGKVKAFPKAKIKEEIGRSPDELDSFLIRMIFELKKFKPKARGYAVR